MKSFDQEINDVIFEDRAVEDALKDYVQAVYVRHPEEMRTGKPKCMERHTVITIGGKLMKNSFK